MRAHPSQPGAVPASSGASPARRAGSAVLLDGKAVAAKVRAEVARRSADFAARHGRRPGLAVVQVGEDPASSVYVRNKRRSSVEAGIESIAHDLAATASEAQILELVHRLNRDPRVDGILVQLPLPKGVNADRVMDAVDPLKDVDGFHPVNTGLLAQKRPRLRPCTPFGVIRLAREYGIDLTGLRATVVGASNIVDPARGGRVRCRHQPHSRRRPRRGCRVRGGGGARRLDHPRSGRVGSDDHRDAALERRRRRELSRCCWRAVSTRGAVGDTQTQGYLGV